MVKGSWIQIGSVIIDVGINPIEVLKLELEPIKEDSEV